MKKLKRKRLSFLCGDSGPLCMAALCYFKQGKIAECRDCIERIVLRYKDLKKDSSIPDELLYGRSGFLYSLLFIQNHIGKEYIENEMIAELCEIILQSGRNFSQNESFPCKLMYEWHDKRYLGAAHGLAGIFFILMQCTLSSENLNELIRPALDYCLDLKFSSGNMPSSIGSSNGDKLVHWCHGSPGWIHTCILAYKTFEDKKYINEAINMSEVIWSRGLLCKGYGLCHGVAGNAYGILAIYQLTKNLKYLHRAIKFAEWCCDFGKHGCRTPDRPHSLFEGLAGMIYFMVDILDPMQVKFPGFYV